MLLATLSVFVVLGLGVCFIQVQTKGLWAELQIARRDTVGRQGRGDLRRAIRSLKIVTAIIAVLGLGYYLGWLRSGIGGGVLTAVVVASVGVLLLAAFAVKSAWFSGK